MLSIDQISKSYVDANVRQQILQQLSVNIAQGESVSIQGASGSGKSTLLHLLAALDKPDSGHIYIDATDNMDTGKHYSNALTKQAPSASLKQQIDITQFTEKQADQYRQVHIGIVFQKFNLIDCISVIDNITLPAKLKKASHTQAIDVDHINGLLRTLSIEKLQHKLPNQLSGGEQQRVAIARSLSHKPRILLADEPTGNLDNKNADIVSKLLIDTCEEQNTSLVLVTHSEKVAMLTQTQIMLNEGKCVLLSQ